MSRRLSWSESARTRTVLVSAALVALLAVGVASVYIARWSASPTTAIAGPDSLPVVARRPVSTTTQSRPRITSRTAVTTAPTTLPRSSTTTAEVVFTPPASSAPLTSGPQPAPTTTPTAAPRILLVPAVTATLPPPPPPFGAKSLTWTAPGSLAVASEATVTFSLTAHNPTDRVVEMPHSLACIPRLDHGETCAPEIQRIVAGGSATVMLTVDAHGVAPGPYTLTIETVLTIPVTVT